MSSTDDAKAAAAKAREDLARTLDQIEDKVNVPKRVGELSKRAQVAYDKNPLPFVVGGAAIAAGVVALIVRAIVSDD